MTNAAVTADARPLDHYWAIAWLPCTEPENLGRAQGLGLVQNHRIREVEPSSALRPGVRRSPRAPGDELGSLRDVVVPGDDPGDGSRGGHRRHRSLSEGGGTSRHSRMGPGGPVRFAALATCQGVATRSELVEYRHTAAARHPAGAGRDPDRPTGGGRAAG